MKYFADGQEISEKEFIRINDNNIALVAEFEKTGNYDLLLDMVFLVQMHGQSIWEE